MCNLRGYTGPKCVHSGMKPDGTPIPVDKDVFMQHIEWHYETDRCAKFAKTGVHCKVALPTYEELTADMSNIPYYYVQETPRVDGDGNRIENDKRCGKCKTAHKAR